MLYKPAAAVASARRAGTTATLDVLTKYFAFHQMPDVYKRQQKPFRREVMRTYGAAVTPSPSDTTRVGRKILEEHPGTSGSLGCAISAVSYTHLDVYKRQVRYRLWRIM